MQCARNPPLSADNTAGEEKDLHDSDLVNVRRCKLFTIFQFPLFNLFVLLTSLRVQIAASQSYNPVVRRKWISSTRLCSVAEGGYFP
jgi:hypothetical protein